MYILLFLLIFSTKQSLSSDEAVLELNIDDIPKKHYKKKENDSYFKSVRGSNDFVIDIESVGELYRHMHIQQYSDDILTKKELVKDFAAKYLERYLGISNYYVYQIVFKDLMEQAEKNADTICPSDTPDFSRESMKKMEREIHKMITIILDKKLEQRDKECCDAKMKAERHERELRSSYRKSKLLVLGNFVTAGVSALITAGVSLIVHFTNGD